MFSLFFFFFFFFSLCFRDTGEAEGRRLIRLTGFTSQISGGSCSPCTRTVWPRRSRRFILRKARRELPSPTYLGVFIRAVRANNADPSKLSQAATVTLRLGSLPRPCPPSTKPRQTRRISIRLPWAAATVPRPPIDRP